MRKCEICNAEMPKLPSHSKKYYATKKYCSRECSAIGCRIAHQKTVVVSEETTERKRKREFRKGYLHRGYQHPIYSAWKNMRRRCYNKNFKQYKDYGGREITVCEEWRSDFVPFLEWALDQKWEHGLSLDRINNNGNYCPENCRWATEREQKLNTRRNSRVTYNGETLTKTEWIEKLNINLSTFNKRLKNWGVSEKTFTQPINANYRHVRKERA